MAEEQKKVVVWKFKNPLSRKNKDFDQAVRIGEANSHKELVEMAGGGYLAFTDPDTDAYMTYSQAEKRFGEAPLAEEKPEKTVVRIIPVGGVFTIQNCKTNLCLDKNGRFSLGTERCEPLLVFDLALDARQHSVRESYEVENN